MLIDVSKIKNATGVAVPFKAEEQWPPLEYQGETLSFLDPVIVEGQLTNTGKVLLVQGNIHAHLGRSCSRCLEPVEETVDIPFEVEYLHISGRDEASRDEVSLTPEEQELGAFDGNDLDLGPRVQEFLLLELPITVLCREDCQGLCNRCGQNLNLAKCQCSHDDIDPRLQVLGKLLKS